MCSARSGGRTAPARGACTRRPSGCALLPAACVANMESSLRSAVNSLRFVAALAAATCSSRIAAAMRACSTEAATAAVLIGVGAGEAAVTTAYEAVRCLPCGKPCCARDVVKPLRKRVLLLITRRGSHSTAAPSKGCARTQERERCRRLLGRRELGARRSTRRRSERDTSSGGAPAGWGVGAGPPPSHPEKLEHGPSLCHPSPARPENPSSPFLRATGAPRPHRDSLSCRPAGGRAAQSLSFLSRF